MARNDKKAMELAADPRLAAFRVLEATEGGRRPEEALNECGLLLSARDMSLATALVYEVLRHRSRLDWLMETRLKNGRAAGALRQTLRLGLAQLLFFDRLGDHAVVMETVALAKAVAPGRQGVVNAILRGLLRDRDRGAVWPPEPPASGDAVQDLARRHSFPPWLTRRMVKQLGAAEAEDFFRAANRPTPPTLRINPLKATGGREEVRRALPFACLPTALSPWGLAASVFAGRPEQWPGFAEGRFALQDEASQLAGLLAGSVGDGAILDACSGLGGKALLLASIFPQARLTAMDRDPAKLEALTREAARLGCAAGLVTETRDLLAAPPPAASFDLALLDAPCSGLGVVRRRPDLKWNKQPQDIARLAEGQSALLAAVAPAVKPGGRLLYGVCSVNDEEGPEIIRRFLADRADFQALPAAAWPESLRPFLKDGPGLTLWPHRHGLDGFFWASLRRSGGARSGLSGP